VRVFYPKFVKCFIFERKKQLKLKFFILIIFLQTVLVGTAQNSGSFVTDLKERTELKFSFAETGYSYNRYPKDSIPITFENYMWLPIPERKMAENSMYVFESEFYVAEKFRSEKIALAVGPMNYPCRLFLNGLYIASYGEIGARYITKTQFSSAVELPDYLLHFADSVNRLTIQVYPEKVTKPALFKYFISSEKNVEQWAFRRNFVRIDLIKGASMFFVVLFFYFVLGYIQRKDKSDKRYLIFAFICLLFSISYINFTISYNSLYELAIYKTARTLTPIVTYLLLLFTIKNTGIFDRKKLLLFLLIPISIAAIYILLQKDIESLEKSFFLFSILVNFPYIIFIFIISLISAVKTGQRNKIVFFIGLIVFIATIVTDTYYFAAHINPYTWYIPLGFFAFLVAIFFILSSEQTQIYHLSIERLVELEKLKDNLELMVVERTKKIEQQKTEIESQSEQIEIQRDAVIERNLEIEKQNQQLTEKNDEISIKNTILNQQKEEISTQLHHLEKLYIELEINNKIIENQKLEIRQKLSDSIAKTIELKNETIKAQLKAITNQMNPHFIFNTLNAIKYFILQNDIQTSDLYLDKFAKLMRFTLYNSINETIILKDEINTLTLYLELEQFRASKKFNYSIHFEDDTIVNNYKIPSLLIQPFVENSIIHGIRTLTYDGKIELDFKIEDDILICIVEDNGVGRSNLENSKKQINHISVGISLITQRLKLMSELYEGNYSFEYVDFQESKDGKTGTKVILKLPIFQQYF